LQILEPFSGAAVTKKHIRQLPWWRVTTTKVRRRQPPLWRVTDELNEKIQYIRREQPTPMVDRSRSGVFSLSGRGTAVLYQWCRNPSRQKPWRGCVGQRTMRVWWRDGRMPARPPQKPTMWYRTTHCATRWLHGEYSCAVVNPKTPKHPGLVCRRRGVEQMDQRGTYISMAGFRALNPGCGCALLTSEPVAVLFGVPRWTSRK
jgi:hypothetical protein